MANISDIEVSASIAFENAIYTAAHDFPPSVAVAAVAAALVRLYVEAGKNASKAGFLAALDEVYDVMEESIGNEKACIHTLVK